MDKEALLQLLQEKFGENIDISLITDEDIAGLIGDTNNEPVPPVDDPDGDDGNNIPPVDENLDGDDDYANVDIEDIDESQLDENGKLLLRIIKDRDKRYKQEKMKALVAGSGVEESSRLMLNKMIKLGITEDELTATIEQLKETSAKAKRGGLLGPKTFGKGQFRDKTLPTTPKKPKLGSAEFGASLFKK